MYGKVFSSMYDGTLAGNWEAIVTMQQLVVLANADGVVDKTPEAIARLTTIPIHIIKKGLEFLAQPDPRSRTPGEDGRRIVLLDEHRDWGWRLVNHGKYKRLRNMEDKREADRARMEEKRKKNKDVASGSQKSQKSQKVADVARVAHADTDTDALTAREAKASPSGPAVPDCPQREILALYANHLPMLTQPRLWEGQRAELLRTRWRVCSKRNEIWPGYATVEGGLAFWDQFFSDVAKASKLTNGIPRGDGSSWKPDLPWLLKAENFAKVIEGKYHR